MRIVFIHKTVIDYTVETPYQRAIGGSEASLAYLAVELARLGHSVVHLGNASTPGRYLGVECLNLRTAFNKELLDSSDAIVVSNEAFGRKLKEWGITKPLVLWTGHADDQPGMEPLEFSRERRAWSGFAFVSQWQLEQYHRVYWIERDKSRVMRNAIAPVFAQAQPSEPWFLRREPPVLAYTSAPYRGLNVLLAAFPAIRSAIPGTRLRVFSGASITRGGPEDNRYGDLRRQCEATDGVEYIGPLSQPELAGSLRDAAALAYPATYTETSCIAAMEAMAIGATVLTTRLGALPETLAGFGNMVEAHGNPATLAKEFAGMAINVLTRIQANPAEAAARREAQIAYSHENYAWPARAIEWQNWLFELIVQQS